MNPLFVSPAGVLCVKTNTVFSRLSAPTPHSVMKPQINTLILTPFSNMSKKVITKKCRRQRKSFNVRATVMDKTSCGDKRRTCAYFLAFPDLTRTNSHKCFLHPSRPLPSPNADLKLSRFIRLYFAVKTTFV